MPKRMSEELVAPCGMNCGICKRYLATTRELYQNKKIVSCIGCRPRNRKCSIIQKSCRLLREDKIKYCFECSDFSCDKLERLNRRYVTRYSTSLINNLTEIQSKGLGTWLEEEQRKWECANCGGVVSIHDLTCYDCGQKRAGT